MKNLILILLASMIYACGTINKAYYSDDALNWEQSSSTSGKEIVHSLYLVGDTGELDDLEAETNIVVEAVKKAISGADKNTSLVCPFPRRQRREAFSSRGSYPSYRVCYQIHARRRGPPNAVRTRVV